MAVFHAKGLNITAGKTTAELTALSNHTKLGPVLMLFLETNCTQTGLPTGDFHINGEWHLVYVALGVSLVVALLILVSKATCTPTVGGSFTLQGAFLQKLEKIPSASESDEIGTITKCEGTEELTPELTKYENEAGTAVTASLLATIAGIKEKVCLGISGEMVLKGSAAGQMFQIDL